MAPRKWTRAKVLLTIQDLHTQRQALNSWHIQLRNPTLLTTAQRLFGSWEMAIRAAGLDYRLIRRRPALMTWSSELVMHKIKTMCEAQQDLRLSSVRRRNKALVMAAVRRFGSWKSALAASGIDTVALARKSRGHNENIRAEVTAKIVSMSVRGEPLNSWYVQQNASILFDRARRTFGSWSAAVAAAGYDYERLRRYRRWKKGDVLPEIRAMYSRGESLSYVDAEKLKYSLIYAANRYFGSWEQAVTAAGYNYKDVCKLYRTKDALAAARSIDRGQMREFGNRRKSRGRAKRK